MSEIRFYADEHVASAVVTGLRLRRVDVLTVQERGWLAPKMPCILNLPWPKPESSSLRTPTSSALRPKGGGTPELFMLHNRRRPAT